MIKFTADTATGKLIGLGLSKLNCERLIAGKPIVVDVKALGLPYRLHILIIGGETENSMMSEVDRLGFELPEDPDKIHIDPKCEG